MTYYNNTVKQMKFKYFLSVFVTIFLLGLMFISGGFDGYGFDGYDIIAIVLISLFGIIVWPIEFLGMILNFIPIIKGFVYPIPFVSFIVECFKSLIMGVKAFVWLIRNWSNS